MHLTLLTPDTLTITHMGNAYDFLSSLTGSEYHKATRTLTVRLCHLRRILTEFPRAEIPSEVIQARLAQWGRWVIQHNQAGIWFGLSADDLATVVPEGPGVSPLFADWVAHHSPQIAPHLGLQRLVSSTAPESPHTVPTAADTLLWAAVEGGAKAEERKKALAGKRKVWKRGKSKQGELGI